MAITTSAKLRRKPAIYGKAFGKPLISFPDLTSKSMVDDTGDSPQYIQRSFSGKNRKKNNAVPDQRHGRSKIEVRGRLRSDIEDAKGKDDTTRASALMNDSHSLARQDHSLYDVPSSDEDHVFPKAHYIATIKRRKTGLALTECGNGIISDDDLSQRHLISKTTRNSPRRNLKGQHHVTPPIPKMHFGLSTEAASASDSDNRQTTKCKRQKSTITVTEGVSIKKADNTISFDQTESAPLEDALMISTQLIREPVKRCQIMKSREAITRKCKKPLPNLDEADVADSKFLRPACVAGARPNSTPQPIEGDLEKKHCPGSPNSLSLHVLKGIHGSTHYTFPRKRLVDRLHSSDYRKKRPPSNDQSEEEILDARSSQPASIESYVTTPEHKISKETLQSDFQNYQYNTSVIMNPPAKASVLPLHCSLKKTYARQRSYLTESDVDNATSFNASPTPHVNTPSRSSRRSQTISLTSGIPSLQYLLEPPDSCEDRSGSIRSIHELRQAGGNERVIGDMEALLDDINDEDDTPLSLRRCALLTLVEKLAEPACCRSFIDRGLEARLLSSIHSDQDMIINILLMLSLTYIVAESRSPHTLALMSNQGVLEHFVANLQSTADLLLTIRSYNLPKATEMGLRRLCDTLLKSSIWKKGPPSQITAQVISLQYIENIVQAVSEAGCDFEILSQQVIDNLVDIMASSMLKSELKAASDFTAEIQLTVSVLESTTTNKGLTWSNESIKKLIQIFTTNRTMPHEYSREIQKSALRLSLNLTNNDQSICEAFLRPEVIQAAVSVIEAGFHDLPMKESTKSPPQELDNLVLALGLLINLAEHIEISQHLFITAHNAQTCPFDVLLSLFNAKCTHLPDVSKTKGISTSLS